MAREVEMDKTAKGLKTLIDSRSMQRWERLLSLLLSFGIQLLLSSDSLKEIFYKKQCGKLISLSVCLLKVLSVS